MGCTNIEATVGSMAALTGEPERCAELSRHFIEKADEYLLAGDRVQASEKGWGAVAEAIKSIAAERGWNHWGHHLLNDAVYQLSEEWGRPDVLALFDSVEKLHINFYEDVMELDEILSRIDSAKSLVDELDALRVLPPKSVTVVNRGQRNRWRRLTGELVPLCFESN